MQSFQWPEDKRVAVSVSFDDARVSQIEIGVPIMNEFKARGTFYVSFPTVESRLELWRAERERGHEIGNHTWTHPCSANLIFSHHNSLEDKTLAQMEAEIVRADLELEKLFGAKPATFAFPCGQKFVGRGINVQSYVPLAAKYFVASRGWRDERPNDPLRCDMAQLMGVEADGCDWNDLRTRIEMARESGSWIIFAAHEVGEIGNQALFPHALEELCRYAQEEKNGVWLDTVETVARYLLKTRGDVIQSTLSSPHDRATP